jgi:hypothetical protein
MLSKGTHELSEPGMVVDSYNPSTQKRQEDHEFKTSLGYIVKSCLKKNKFWVIKIYKIYILLAHSYREKMLNLSSS